MIDYSNTKATESAVERIERAGLPTPWTHEEHRTAELPRSLDTVRDDLLGRQLGTWASLIAMAMFELARVKADTRNLSTRMKWIRAKLTVEFKGTDTPTNLKAKIETREDMVKLQQRLDAAENMATLLDALVEGYRKKFDAVSREITRREKERAISNRSAKGIT